MYPISPYLSEVRVLDSSFPASRTVLDVARGGEREETEETEDAQRERAAWHGGSSGQMTEGSQLLSSWLTHETDNCLCRSRTYTGFGLFDVSVVNTQPVPPLPHTH